MECSESPISKSVQALDLLLLLSIEQVSGHRIQTGSTQTGAPFHVGYRDTKLMNHDVSTECCHTDVCGVDQNILD